MSFDTLGLSPELIRAVADEGYTEPTPVQPDAIPLVSTDGTCWPPPRPGPARRPPSCSRCSNA